MALFTREELEELRRADEELDKSFRQTQAEIAASRKLDRQAVLDSMDPKKKTAAQRNAAYYEANREKIAAAQKEYYEANREKIAAAQKEYREANREKYNAYMREYMRKRRAMKKGKAAAR